MPVAQLDRVPGFEPGGREFDKIAGSNFERPQDGPQGGGQDARNNLSGEYERLVKMKSKVKSRR